MVAVEMKQEIFSQHIFWRDTLIVYRISNILNDWFMSNEGGSGIPLPLVILVGTKRFRKARVNADVFNPSAQNCTGGRRK